jgi:CxxC-x17-CxxC domain-containing protein
MSASDLEGLANNNGNGPPAGNELEDVSINCIDCSYPFIWTAGEQVFFRDKHLLNPPKRCKDCKRAKNRRLEAIETANATGKRQHFEVQAKCAKCDQMTTVPFYPSQGRPVYCRACYLEMRPATTVAGGQT